MKIRLAVVGIGKMGEWHLQKALAHPQVAVTALLDHHPGRAAQLSEKYGVPAIDTLDDVLRASDALVIASSTDSHYELTRRVLSAGKAVLVEKPLALEPGQVEELTRIAHNNGVLLQVGFVERARWTMIAPKLPLMSPATIEYTRHTVSPGRDLSVGVIGDLMVHDLDLLAGWKLGNPTDIQIRSVGSQDGIEARLEFGDGCVVRLSADRHATAPQRTVGIFQPERAVWVDLNGGRIAIRETGEAASTELEIGACDPLAMQFDRFVERYTNSMGTPPAELSRIDWVHRVAAQIERAWRGMITTAPAVEAEVRQ